jgi:hypothetical protein
VIVKGRTSLSAAALALVWVMATGACASQNDGEQAEVALQRYFSSLHEGDFTAAAELYGGSYDQLAAWNPDLHPDDHAALLQRGCLVNGLQCLPVMSIDSRQHSGLDTYEITIQLENPDGSVYTLTSTDAAAAGNREQSKFVYTVVRSGKGFVIRELPPYAE